MMEVVKVLEEDLMMEAMVDPLESVVVLEKSPMEEVMVLEECLVMLEEDLVMPKEDPMEVVVVVKKHWTKHTMDTMDVEDPV